jgi:predicted anti-sigma-YlaC factor YlaD
MACQNFKEMMMAYLDNELDQNQRQILEQHLQTCSDCSKEMAEFKKLKQITDNVTLVEPEDRIWEQYWGGVYNRIERGLGWIIFSVAAILLTIYGGFKLIEELITDPTVGLLLKVTIVFFIIGLAILFVSVLRERIYFWSKDRYKDVRR